MRRVGTEAASPRYEAIDAWSSNDVLDALWEGQAAAVAAVRPALPAIARAVEAAAPLLADGGRLAYAGAGTSGRIGVQDGAELPPTFDWPETRLILLIAGGEAALTHAVENAEDRADLAAAEIAAHEIGTGDVLVALAASGSTPYTLACVAAAAKRGALTVGVASNPDAALLQAADHPILVETGPEAIAGSTRLKAGTAQKIVLNLFSTALMVRLGRVYRGRMVDMQARNSKLRRRALRMLCDLAGIDESAAATALQEAGGKVKAAVLVARGATRPAAETLLAQHGGQLRPALAALDGARRD